MPDLQIFYPLKMSTSKQRARAIEKLPLKEQCQTLSLNYSEIVRDRPGKPEPVALARLCDDGWSGSNCEGGTIKCLLKAAAFTGIGQRHELGQQDVKGRYLIALLITQGHSVEHLRQEVYLTSLAEIRARYEAIRSLCEETGLLRNLATTDVALKIFEALGRHAIYGLLQKCAKHNSEIAAGWPDLTIVKGDTVRFIEVKESDKLHYSQIRTIPELNDVLPDASAVEVCRITRKT